MFTLHLTCEDIMPQQSYSRLGVLALSVLLLLCCRAYAFDPMPAQPDKAVFYPDEVEVTIERNLVPEALPAGGTGFLLSLPPGVKSNSFLIAVDGLGTGGYYWLDPEERDALLARLSRMPAPGKATLPENEPSPERRALLEKLVPLDEEVAGKEGALASVQSRISLWEKSLEQYGAERDSGILNQPSPADEAAKLNEAYDKQLPALYLERERQSRALEDARIRQAKAKEALDDFDHKKGCDIVAVPLPAQAGGTVRGELPVRYSYVLPGSCAMSYRIGAYPDKGEISVAQDAVLAQHSGFAWTDAEIFVSTLRRDRVLQPGNVRPWTIALIDKPAPPPADADERYTARQRVRESVPMAAVVQSAVPERELAKTEGSWEFAFDKPDSRPVAQEHGTFRMWSLGKRRIEDKAPVTMSLATDTYTASFQYTIRPVSNPKGFLTARLALDKALELPPGTAQFSVDGAAIGSRMFSFNGNTGVIFFGSDPQVTATMRDMQKSGGQQGFFSKEQTLLWHWQITLKNSRSKAVEVVLEDPAPVASDSAVTIKSVSAPKPETVVNAPEYGGATIYRWKAALKPGEPLTVDHKVEVSAPADKDKILDPGFRR